MVNFRVFARAMSTIAKNFEVHQVVPDVIPKAPTALVHVSTIILLYCIFFIVLPVFNLFFYHSMCGIPCLRLIFVCMKLSNLKLIAKNIFVIYYTMFLFICDERYYFHSHLNIYLDILKQLTPSNNRLSCKVKLFDTRKYRESSCVRVTIDRVLSHLWMLFCCFWTPSKIFMACLEIFTNISIDWGDLTCFFLT